MSMNVDINQRPQPDKLLVQIAEYVASTEIESTEAYHTARHCLMDTLGCGLLALRFPSVPSTSGRSCRARRYPRRRVARHVPRAGSVAAAFNIGCIIRWLDFNDTWLAAEWGHPSDNLAGSWLPRIT